MMSSSPAWRPPSHRLHSEMRRTVWTYPRSDGGTDVITQGPIGRGLGMVRLAMLAFVGIAVLVALFSGQWSAAGVLLLLFALLVPNLRKRAKLRARLPAQPSQ
jgi:hypothetical protein